MRKKQILFTVLLVIALLGGISVTPYVLAATHDSNGSTSLVDDVRRATARYKDMKAAEAAGYGLFHGCVNGPEQGAMGVHFVKGDLVGDGKIDASTPEALIYEWKNGNFQLVGVEYVVIAQDWDAANSMPPVLKGQLFTYSASPNRYGIPAFYALHVWAWKNNPNGAFADWNSQVSCEQFTGDTADHNH